jgi:hypothetical protein
MHGIHIAADSRFDLLFKASMDWRLPRCEVAIGCRYREDRVSVLVQEGHAGLVRAQPSYRFKDDNQGRLSRQQRAGTLERGKLAAFVVNLQQQRLSSGVKRLRELDVQRGQVEEQSARGVGSEHLPHFDAGAGMAHAHARADLAFETQRPHRAGRAFGDRRHPLVRTVHGCIEVQALHIVRERLECVCVEVVHGRKYWLLSQIATYIDHVPVLLMYAASQCGVEGIQPCVLPETVVCAVVAGTCPRVPSATQVVEIMRDVACSLHVHTVLSQQGVRVKLSRQLQARHRTMKGGGRKGGNCEGKGGEGDGGTPAVAVASRAFPRLALPHIFRNSIPFAKK